MIDQIPDAASIYWQSTIHRSWYQELVKIQGGEGGNADLIPQGSQDKIVIPSRFRGSLLDIRLGEHWAFIAEEYGEIKYGRGLEYFIETELQGYHRDDLAHLFGHEGWKIATPAAIFDNHNHALYFWARALSLGHIQK